MKKHRQPSLIIGSISLAAFAVLTAALRLIDVQPVGINATNVGFSTFNRWFHGLTGVHMVLYSVTDWLSLIPLFVCMVFAGTGAAQAIKRRSILRVDPAILLLGVYYLAVILCYLVFEAAAINFRPVLIEGRMEASYPSSTTLLVLAVMPTLVFPLKRMLKPGFFTRLLGAFLHVYSFFMVSARLLSGIHWFTDIIGAILLSTGLFHLFKAAVILFLKR